MFRSRRRAVVFPQAEHARLAGTIALAWGNAAIERPPLPFEAFVRGVTLHDRGYGQLDADGIGEVPQARWLAIQRASFEPRGDAVVDLVVALHVRRLVGRPADAAEAEAAAAMDAGLPGLHEAARVTREAAAAADRVTDLCDRVAFDFCLEEPACGAVAVVPHDGAADVVEVRYAMDGGGDITLAPWPLAPPEVGGLVLAFAANGYPGRLEPVVVPFTLRPG